MKDDADREVERARAPAPVTGSEPTPIDQHTVPYSTEIGPVPAVGAQIGRYLVRGVVGSGGMGLVLAAHDPELGRLVAIKLVARNDAQARSRLVREAQAMARLSHPNVVTVHEVIRLGEHAGIVMELVDGDDLSTWGDAAPRTWREILAAYTQAARGLAAAHRAGLVHRDFKPSNALIDRDGNVRVTDFGLVRATGGADHPLTSPSAADAVPALDMTLTGTGAIMGTPAFMAPEQHRGAEVDARTDQWALACSLYTALYRQRPFEGSAVPEVSAAVLAGAIRPEPGDTDVPRAIREAIRKGLALDPADRFPTMDELVAALSPTRRGWRIGAAAAAVALVALLAAILVRRDDRVTCTDLGAPLAAFWDEARARALRARLEGRAAADHVVGALDRHASRWVATRRLACTEGQQGVGSAELLDRRMRCLDHRLVEMATMVGALLQGDRNVLGRAGEAVDGLPGPDGCRHPGDRTPMPTDPRARRRIASAEDAVARGRAFHALGQCDKALPLAREASTVGEETGWPPLLAQALVLRGECESRERDYEGAVATLDRAATAAARARDDALMAEALGTRFYVLGERLGRPADAMAGRSFIELVLERGGQPRRERALWLHSLAVVLLGLGKLDEALAAQSEATATWRQLVPPGHVNLVDSIQTEANIQSSRGNFDAAGALLAEAMAAEVAVSGPDHPRVAVVLTNLGLLEVYRGDIPAAIEQWRRALVIQRAAGIADWIAAYNVGVSQLSLGRWRAAAIELSSALAAAEVDAPGDTRPVAACSSALGAVLVEVGELDRAAGLLARSVSASRASGDPPVTAEALLHLAQLALVRRDLAAARSHVTEAAKLGPETPLRAAVAADVLRAERGCAAARPAYRHALAIARADSVLEVTLATTGLGECLVDLDAPADAVDLLAPRVAWLEQVGADPAAAARARFALARALVASGGDLQRAHGLAAQAAADLGSLGSPAAGRAAAVTDWMKRQRWRPASSASR